MIKVLQVVYSLDVGGIQTFLTSLYQNIDRNKIQFDFLIKTKDKGMYEDEIEKLGGKIYRISSNRRHLFKYRKELKKFCLEHKEYKIVHFHRVSLNNIQMIRMIKKVNNPTIILHSRNNNSDSKLFRKILHVINKSIIDKYVDIYLSISDLAAKWLFPKKIYKKKKYEVINNGICLNNFLYEEKTRNKIRKELKIENAKVVGHVGRFEEQKNHEFLIDVFKEISKKEKKAILLLVGNGKLKDNICQKVKNYKLEDKVIFVGEKNNPSEYYQAMDVLLFPSLYEGLGRVLIEAQAADLPCIVSDKVIPTSAKILETYITVDLKESAEKWADVTLESLQYKNRKNRRQEIKKAGYDMVDVAKKFANIYIEIDNKMKK